jgi:alpha-amylase/alpha-mannosidase (GH57 family)
MAEPLSIVFLWHMHQPYYKEPVRGEYLLPWTYLHAVKDYYDMAAIVADTPGAKVVFNLVPSLLEQIRDYATGTAVDPFLIRGQMSSADMSEEDRLFLLENFFSANRQRMIEPYPRYLELLYLAGDGAATRLSERLRHFRDQELLDLQVWFFLAWTGEAARRRFPELQELVHKGKHFTPADKSLLFAVHRQILGDIIPLYRRLHEEGKAELAVSPYFHPILPLLCDMKSARTAMPKVTLPTARFRHPEDARSQVYGGIAYFRDTFGFTPRGMWPSEGSVSDEALAIIAGSGIEWAASDEGVLVHTLPGGLGPGREELYQAYAFQAGEQRLGLFFRDHALSDLIGFTYSQWDAARAVEDFIGRLRDIRHRTPDSRVVSVILDGENAWEYYPGNAYTFLSRLYSAIAEEKGLQLSTFSEVVERVPPRQILSHIHPGSWINANYGIWVGHPEENLGWDHVARARAAAVAYDGRVAELMSRGTAVLDPAEMVDERTRQICRALYAAEGSDWFWWYGDDHFSPHSDRFDALFRKYLIHVYSLLDQEAPRELYQPIKLKSPAGFVRDPAAMITPTINGLVTDYFEWLAAGLYDLTKQASAMHSAESLLQSFFYGFDRSNLYFRIDGVASLDRSLQGGDILALHLLTDRECRLGMDLSDGEGRLQCRGEGGWDDTVSLCRWKIVRVCEAAVPLDAVSPAPGGKLFAYLTLTRGKEEVGRWPTDAPMVLKYAGPDIELENWLI